jgi:hypothetical protein
MELCLFVCLFEYVYSCYKRAKLEQVGHDSDSWESETGAPIEVTDFARQPYALSHFGNCKTAAICNVNVFQAYFVDD